MRIELDGESASLWIDGKQAAREDSDFRAAHAFKPGEPKRNFLGATREGSLKFQGVFGSTAVYHTAHGAAFDYLDAPVVKTPERPKMEFLHWARRQRTIAPSEAEDRTRAAVEAHNRYIDTIGTKAAVRLYELRNRSEEWVQVVRQSDYCEVMVPGKVRMPDDFDFDAWTFMRGPLHYGAAWAWRWPPRSMTTHAPVSVSYPMTPVSWCDAVRFCKYLTELEREAGRLPEGYVYRLPTEAEWEYAARARTKGPYSFDFDLDEDDKDRFAQYVATSREGGTHFGPADTRSGRKPNPWGLKDVHGNVYEWCLDWYGPYRNDARTDPVGLAEDRERAERVARGGGLPDWGPAERRHAFYRSASRYSFPAHTDYQISLGFRVVLAPEEPLHSGCHPAGGSR